jgi:hypothetical protein
MDFGQGSPSPFSAKIEHPPHFFSGQTAGDEQQGVCAVLK